MTVEEMKKNYASNKAEEEWMEKMISMMMVLKKHEYLKSRLNK